MIYRLSAALALALFAATSEAVVLRNQITVEDDDTEPLEGVTIEGDSDHPSVNLDIDVNGEDADGIPDD